MSQVIDQLTRVEKYSELLKAVRAAFAVGRDRAFKAVEQEKVRTAWEVGRLINRHVLEQKRAGYAEQVLVRLAKDLGKSRTELYYMLEFAKTYPIVPAPGQLTWSHYRELLSVNDAEKRRSLIAAAAKQGFSQKQTRQLIRQDRIKADGAAVKKALDVPVLKAKPGRVGAYQIIVAAAGPYAGKLVVDLGFSNYLSPAGPKKFKAGEIVQETNRRLRKSNAAAEDIFTYRAYVVEVLDGDTFKVLIDFGFGFTSAQVLRLRGLDAPEMSCLTGQAAKRGLERLLGNEGRVIIRTTKSDKYDRYLADVFVPRPGRDELLYVNQELVGRGFAVVV